MKTDSAAFKTSTSPDMPPQNFDIDQFLDLDHTAGPSPSASPANVKSFPIPSPNPIGVTGHPQQPSTRTFAGPSHQYEQYKQQTGLPVGALANTFALNEPERYQHPTSYDFNSATDGWVGMNTVEPDFVDFNTSPAQTTSPDVEMDYGTMNLNNPNFVNPAAVSGASPSSYSQTSHPGRVWPGMHQQAALAKAQQQAALAAQRQRSASASAQGRRESAVEEGEHEEIVEESISRLLSRMRNGSVASSVHDESGQGALGSSGAYPTRSKKEEEDMDEDERLLASEEGKKLSSKERRQLRNKVSARAFRSRRKEYIGQLEGELAAKTAEADELRAKNQELASENSRLTDLTRMLLSSPSFSGFLNDLSGTGLNSSPVPGLPLSRSYPNATQQATQQKDSNPNQYNYSRSHNQNNNTHIGMAMIPEEAIVEADHPTDHRYSHSANTSAGLFDAQVYALTNTTDPAPLDSIDFTVLSDKTSSIASLYEAEGLKEAPIPVEVLPTAYPTSTDQQQHAHTSSDEESTVDGEYDNNDVPAFTEAHPAYALYADTSAPSVDKVDAPEGDDSEFIFGSIPLSKATERIDLVLSPDGQTEADESITRLLEVRMQLKFDRLCAEMDVLAARIASVTGHLS